MNILIGLREDLLIWKIWEKIFFFGLSNIRISKNNVNLCGDVVCKAAYILDDKDREEEYTNISEGILL